MIPRPEYPRPQFVRDTWLNLNGPWEFEADHGDSGLQRGLLKKKRFDREILVPFCPESELSGIHHVDFMDVVWYRREVTIPNDAAWDKKRGLLHFQACDYDTTVWVDGEEVGRHRGGFCGFTCDLGVIEAGQKLTIVVRARDDHRQTKPQGKQSSTYNNRGCHYTRTTGIWQTVWIEPVSLHAHLLRPRITPDVGGSRFIVQQPIRGQRPGLRVRARLMDERGTVASATADATHDFQPTLVLPIGKERTRLWDPEDPFLYDLKIELIDPDGTVIDEARSYAGLRSVTIDGPAVKINGRTIFQRLVLDQGYYPDGIMTAPSDEALVRDIELSLEAGFNGARLHQKVFEERFLYHADRLGYLVWGEFGDWAPARNDDRLTASFITEWLEVLERDYNHPSIIGWCPLNETHDSAVDRITQHDDVMRGMFLATKAMDQTRPVLDTSGYTHRVPESDIYDSHNYTQNPRKFASQMKGLADGEPFFNGVPNKHNPDHSVRSIEYRGQPYFVSEFGGIWWNPELKKCSDQSWGYGERCRTVEQVYRRFEGLCATLLDDPLMFGYCYTQLTDVYQEQNGIYNFDRSVKLDIKRIRAAQQRPAAIEKADRKRRKTRRRRATA